MKLFAGTSGFSYKEWLGKFYPDKLPAADMLGYYAERLPTVEINNTFYRMPKSELIETWATKVPDSFRFVFKASRRITHVKRLKDAGEETDYLLSRLAPLGERLGAVLFQLPPFLRKDHGRLQTFIQLLPGGFPAAFEFRHPSWFDDDIQATLAERDLALCIVDTDVDDDNAPWWETARWGYLRLRRAAYGAPELEAWSQRIAAAGWQHAYAMFKHEDKGPEYALELNKLSTSG